MRIAIDIRSLIEPSPSGISEYTKQITSALLNSDSQNEYHLFINLASEVPDSVKLLADQENVYLRAWHYPNKLFNAALFLTRQPKLNRMLGGQVDLFFLPNINFAAISSSCPMILTIHDISFRYSSFYNTKGKFWHRVVVPQRLILQANHIITVSESTKQDVLDHYDVPDERIHVIHHGVDHDRFNNIDDSKSDDVLNKYGIVGKYVLYFGTIESRKNVAGLIDAWRIVQQKYNTDHQLVIAGRIGDKSLVRRWTSAKFTGYVNEDDKPHIFKKATALVYPSYYEGFGLPVLEAMATGVPVISSFSTSLSEIANDAALLVDPYNSEELAFAIASVLNDVTLREKMIIKGKDYSKKFTWVNTAKQTLRIFNTLQ